MAKNLETLVSPDGKREWDPDDAAQSVNLKAKGWKSKAAAAAEEAATQTEAKPASKAAATPANK